MISNPDLEEPNIGDGTPGCRVQEYIYTYADWALLTLEPLLPEAEVVHGLLERSPAVNFSKSQEERLTSKKLALLARHTASGTRDFMQVFSIRGHIYVFETSKLRHGKWH